MRAILRSSAVLTGATLFEASLSLVSTVALVRMAGLGAAGIVFFWQSVASVVVGIADIRPEDAYVYYAARLAAPQRDLLVRWLAAWDIIVNTLIFIVAVALTLAFSPGREMGYGLAALAAALISASGGVSSAELTFRGRFSHLALARCCAALVGLLVKILMLLTNGPAGYLYAHVLAALLGLLLLRSPRRYRGGQRVIPLAQLRSFFLPAFGAGTVAGLVDRGFLALVGLVASDVTVAATKVAETVGRLILTAASSTNSVVFPLLARLIAADRVREAQKLLAKISTAMALAGFATSVPLLLFGRTILSTLFGEPASDLVRPYSFFIAAYALRSGVIWAKILGMAVGKPLLRLIELILESLILLSILLINRPSPAAIALVFLLTALFHVGAWLSALLLLGRLARPWASQRNLQVRAISPARS